MLTIDVSPFCDQSHHHGDDIGTLCSKVSEIKFNCWCVASNVLLLLNVSSAVTFLYVVSYSVYSLVYRHLYIVFYVAVCPLAYMRCVVNVILIL